MAEGLTPEQQERFDDLVRVGMIGIGQALYEARRDIGTFAQHLEAQNG
jgi:hypothetical protein